MQRVHKQWWNHYTSSGERNTGAITASAPLWRPQTWGYGLALVVGLALALWPRASSLWAATLACAGNNPANPWLATDTWVALANGERHWYAFRDEGDSTTITVRMTVVPEHRAAFRILTPEQFQRWQRGEKVEAVGAGTEPALFYHDLYWTGSFVQSGTYYVLVESTGQGLSNYKLTIRGEQISFPLQRFPVVGQIPACPAADRQPLPIPTPDTEQASLPALIASSPENPLPPIGKSLPIGEGEMHWYAFRDEGDESSIQIRADATPDTCLTFQVWTPEQLQRWQVGEEVRPVGQGTANATLKADLFWAGSFVKSGIYYVVVRRNPATPSACTYALTVSGDDVSLPTPSVP